MKLEQKLFFPSQYIQGYGLIDRLPEIMGKYGDKIMALVADNFADRLQEVMKDQSGSIVEVFTGECTFSEVDRVHKIAVDNGVLVGLHLNGMDKDEMKKVYSFCKDVGLPITFTEIGLDNPTDEELKIISEDACNEYSFIFNEPVEITVEKVLSALLAADKMGREFKG